MSNTPSVFIQPKGRISNRRFIERIKEWGGIVLRSNGEWTTVVVRDSTIKVRSPQISQGNSTETFTDVLNALGLTWEKFMTADLSAETWQAVMDQRKDQRYRAEVLEQTFRGDNPPEYINFLHGEALLDDERFNRRKDRKAREAAAREQKERNRMSQTSTQEPPSTNAQEIQEIIDLDSPAMPTVVRDAPDEEKEAEVQRSRMINRVFDLLVESGEPMSNNRIAEALGITPAQATGCLLGLVQHDVIERVKPGIYRAKSDLLEQTTVRHNVQTGGPIPVSVVEQAKAVFVDRSQASTVTRGIGSNRSLDAEETINDVLDLMFPNGMRLRAADLALLDDWKALTAEVLRRAGG